MRQGGRRAVPRWLHLVAWLLAAITLVRALLLEYVVTPNFWSLLKIALAFAVFSLAARFASGLGKHRLPVLNRTLALAVPIVLVASARWELGTPPREVLAAALSALIGGIAGAVLAEMLNADEATDGSEGDSRKA